MTEDVLVPALFLVTVVLAVVLAAWSFQRARRARRNHEHSADARVHGNAPGNPPAHAAARVDRDADGPS